MALFQESDNGKDEKVELFLVLCTVFIAASFLGARFAKSIVNRIPQQHFRKVVAVFLLLVGAKLILLPG